MASSDLLPLLEDEEEVEDAGTKAESGGGAPPASVLLRPGVARREVRRVGCCWGIGLPGVAVAALVVGGRRGRGREEEGVAAAAIRDGALGVTGILACFEQV